MKLSACTIGVHIRALEGSGLMQDGLICVDCGRDKYPEVFGVAIGIRQWSGKIDRTPEGRQRAWEVANA